MKDSYEFPPIDLLKKAPIRRLYSDSEILALRKKIKSIFNARGVEIRKIQPFIVGPSVYYIEVVFFSDIDIDIIPECLAEVNPHGSIRIISVAEGLWHIAIEVPRTDRQIAGLREVLESKIFQKLRGKLPIALGIPSSENNAFGVSLYYLPPILIGGEVGSGKSVLLHSIALSLLYSQTPDELKFIMIDIKGSEFAVYNKIKDKYLHMFQGIDEGVITSDIAAVRALYALCDEMDRRFSIFSELCCQDIQEYKEKIKKMKSLPKDKSVKMPHIVVMIDEFSELMLKYSMYFELPLKQLAEKGISAGIHLVIATNYLSKRIVNESIQSYFPTRISFKVNSADDSITMLDLPDAELLTGKGDMMYRLSWGELRRVQGCFVDTWEIEDVCDYIAATQGPEEQNEYQNPASQEVEQSDHQNSICHEEERLEYPEYPKEKVSVGLPQVEKEINPSYIPPMTENIIDFSPFVHDDKEAVKTSKKASLFERIRNKFRQNEK